MENKHTNYYSVAEGTIFTNVYVLVHNTIFIIFIKRNDGVHLFLYLCEFIHSVNNHLNRPWTKKRVCVEPRGGAGFSNIQMNSDDIYSHQLSMKNIKFCFVIFEFKIHTQKCIDNCFSETIFLIFYSKNNVSKCKRNLEEF